jgi:hypothetical protein
MKGLIDIHGPVQPPGLGSTAKLRVISPLALALFPSGAPDHSTSNVRRASARAGKEEDQQAKATIASSGACVSFISRPPSSRGFRTYAVRQRVFGVRGAALSACFVWLPGPLPNSRPLTPVIVQRAPKKARKHGPILSMTIHCRTPQSEL